MAKKLSALKINKIIEYKNAGCSQHHTAAKLHINQSTVCHYWNKFDAHAKAEGLEAATEKYGGSDATEINAFMAEMKKENLSLPDVKAGFNMVQLFEKLEVWPEGYENAIKTCLKVSNEEGFLDNATELVELEEKLGKSGLDVISDLKDKDNKVKEAKADLDKLYLLIKSTKKELDGLKGKRHAATKELKQHMKDVGTTLHRLELVENLSFTLKKASISDEAIGIYLKRQAFLDEAKLNLVLLTAVVKQAKIATAQDSGQALLSALNEYGNLTGACAGLKAEVKSLKGQVANLEQQAALKAKMEVEVSKLKAEKAGLEPQVANLHSQKEKLKQVQNQLSYIKNEVNSLTSIKGILEQEVSMLESQEESLKKEIGNLAQKVSDLSELEAKFDAVSTTLTDLESKKNHIATEWEIFENFLGIVGSSLSAEKIEKFAATVPQLVDLAKQQQYTPELLRNFIIKELSGGTLEILRCKSCKARFYIDKPIQDFEMARRCLHCGSLPVEIDVTGPEIIKKALYALAQKVEMTTTINLKHGPQKNPEQSESPQ